MSLKKTLRTKLNQAKKRDKKVKITDIAMAETGLDASGIKIMAAN